MKGGISTGTVPEGLQPVYVHQQSRALSDILVDMLRNSNNYTANQIFLEIGGHSLGGPVSLEKSLAVANEKLAAHGLAAAIHLEEGSGISRGNRFTARGLAKVLALFAPHADLMRGHDGGWNKTGTMEGIRTLAGYADTSSHGQVRFVISLAGDDGGLRFRLLRASSPGCSRRFAGRSRQAPNLGGGTFAVRDLSRVPRPRRRPRRPGSARTAGSPDGPAVSSATPARPSRCRPRAARPSRRPSRRR